MIEVCIPSVGQEVLRAEKTHTVFKLDVLFNGRKHSLQRRYSEFHALHKRGVLWHNQDVPKELLEFLKVKHFQQSSKHCSLDSLTELTSEETSPSVLLCHRPVVGFHKDPYVLPSCTDVLPELVVAGVLEGHYRLGTGNRVKTATKVLKLPPPLRQPGP
ncbi:sorting nexin-22 isoform X5 [Rhinatrema bivittatum]|uniref:sorting nexin-22 isoform X5 n=1 Tax=Rhinatrema bivittatum TaxID=194408 RepID=UPI00112AEA6E|nr:sorting nexin-22 isoform X5 [Rhinatrema bivittatum]